MGEIFLGFSFCIRILYGRVVTTIIYVILTCELWNILNDRLCVISSFLKTVASTITLRGNISRR